LHITNLTIPFPHYPIHMVPLATTPIITKWTIMVYILPRFYCHLFHLNICHYFQLLYCHLGGGMTKNEYIVIPIATITRRRIPKDLVSNKPTNWEICLMKWNGIIYAVREKTERAGILWIITIRHFSDIVPGYQLLVCFGGSPSANYVLSSKFFRRSSISLSGCFLTVRT
jgi:hypothetical protein